MKQVIIFLDFDGVFHPYFSEQKFEDLPTFENIIREYKNRLEFKIVISSSWKKRKSLEQIKSIFSKDISDIIISVAPTLEDADGSRLKEAQMWLEDYNQECEWIALDDDHYAWNKSENLIWCLDKFKEHESTLLRNKLNSFL